MRYIVACILHDRDPLLLMNGMNGFFFLLCLYGVTVSSFVRAIDT